MVRKVLAILLYIVAGFFVYVVAALAFMKTPGDQWKKYAILAGFAAPGVISMVIGLAVEGFARWRTRVGTVLVSGAAATVFIAGTIAVMLLEPEFQQMITPRTLEVLSDYRAGVVFLVGALGIGAALLVKGKRRSQPLP